MTYRISLRCFIASAVTCSVFGLGTCAHGTNEPEGTSTGAIMLADLDVQGDIAPDACVHLANRRAARFAALRLNVTRTARFKVTMDIVADPEVRILSANAHQVARGRQSF